MTEPGQVITFYSYKGGTGRSMALANVACLLAARSDRTRPVLMMDWDLEAPGLHRYFQTQVIGGKETLENHRGLIELFHDLQARIADFPRDEDAREEAITRHLSSVDLQPYVMRTTIDGLLLMKAGRFDDDYSERVNRFQWEHLFEMAPILIPALAEELARRYSFVLIDSRTGHTDIGGVCTMLMPEKLVLVFTPNNQSISGVVDLGRRAVRYRQRSDDLRPLKVFPLASRIEASEPKLREQWREGDPEKNITGYQPQFEQLIRECYGLGQNIDGTPLDLSTYFSEVQIQQIPTYAYGESIAVLLERGDRLSLARSYEAFAHRLISMDGPWQEATGEDGRNLQALAAAKAQAAAQQARSLWVGRLARVAGTLLVGAAAVTIPVVMLTGGDDDDDDDVAAADEEQDDRLTKELLVQLEQAREKLETTTEQSQQWLSAVTSVQRLAQAAEALGQEMPLEWSSNVTQTVDASVVTLNALESEHEILAQRLPELIKGARHEGTDRPDGADPAQLLAIASEQLRLTGERLVELRARAELLRPALEEHRRQTEESAPRQAAREAWREGYAAFLRGDDQTAIRRYEAALEADNTFAPAHDALGRMELMRGKFAEAVQRFEAALDHSPTYVPALSNLALAHLTLARKAPAGSSTRQRELGAATDDARKALKLQNHAPTRRYMEEIDEMRRADPTRQGSLGPQQKGSKGEEGKSLGGKKVGGRDKDVKDRRRWPRPEPTTPEKSPVEK